MRDVISNHKAGIAVCKLRRQVALLMDPLRKKNDQLYMNNAWKFMLSNNPICCSTYCAYKRYPGTQSLYNSLYSKLNFVVQNTAYFQIDICQTCFLDQILGAENTFGESNIHNGHPGSCRHTTLQKVSIMNDVSLA